MQVLIYVCPYFTPTCCYLSDIFWEIYSSSKRQHKQHNTALSLFFSQDTHTHRHTHFQCEKERHMSRCPDSECQLMWQWETPSVSWCWETNLVLWMRKQSTQTWQSPAERPATHRLTIIGHGAGTRSGTADFWGANGKMFTVTKTGSNNKWRVQNFKKGSYTVI